MKLYTLSECYTPNERGAAGFVSGLFLYKSKEEAVAKMNELVSNVTEAPINYEENVIIHNVSISSPSGVKVGSANACDYEDGYYTWEIKEYEL